jgi:predicted negative regulator of RcsB-dependent stress response
MARRITQKELKHDEFVDAAWDFGHWLEENWPAILKWGAGIVLAVLVAFSWAEYSRRSANRARTLLAEAVAQYQKVDAAGFTDPGQASAMLESFETVRERGGDSGRLARYMEGATLRRLGRLDEAVAALESVCADPVDTLCASSRMMLARAHADADRIDDAVTVLQALADHEAAAIPADRALVEMARLQLDAGRKDEARRNLQRVVAEFPAGVAVAEARELLR